MDLRGIKYIRINSIFDVVCDFVAREVDNVFNLTWTVQTPHRKQTAHPETVLPCELDSFGQGEPPTTEQ